MRQSWLTAAVASSALVSPSFAAITLDFTDPNSIKRAASQIAFDLMSYYKGNVTGNEPGLLPNSGQPNGYYWWEGGAMFGAMVDYWYFTGDSSYNDVTTQALLAQVGPNNDYEPPEQKLQLGNDDQAFWGMAALTAAEQRFPNPPSDKPQWLALAQAVWSRQQARWDTGICNGGLRWQIFPLNAGYNYKNAISNGCFFNLGARLGKYTGNSTYLEWAEMAWDWSVRVKIIDTDYNIYDGTASETNCTTTIPYQWTYNNGVYMYGAAAMWNISTEQGNATAAGLWQSRLQGLIKGLDVFFPADHNNIMTETACEDTAKCNTDQHSFKAYLSRWMADTMQIAPWTYSTMKPMLERSATAAVKICTGGASGTQCGFKWSTGQFDGDVGIGQQMNALEVVQSNLITTVQGPVNQTMGISTGNVNAGTGSDGDITLLPAVVYGPVSAGQKAGGAILTILVGCLILGGGLWMTFFD